MVKLKCYFVAWSVLNPLLMMLVMWAVFGGLFPDLRGGDILNYPIFLLCGQLLFNFFRESTTLAMSSVLNNAPLLRKVYIPKYIFPLEKTCFGFVNCCFSFIALVLVMLFTLSPVHSNEYFAKYAKTLEEMGANSICIKDMAGLLTPYAASELVKELKATISIPVDIHSHYTSGLASMSILKGIEAGADIIDTAISPLALGTSHMPTESLVAALQGTEYDTGLDLKKLNVVRAHFAKLREKYLASGQLSPKMLGVDANTLLYQVPGGMLSNLLKQLKDAGKEDMLDDVLQEIPRVRKDSGYPPLVTPTSQIVGTQAVFNVILGERYKMVTKEFKGLVHGDYGRTPAPISPEFTKQILGDEQPITCRPADLLQPEMEKLKKEAEKWSIQEEDALTYAMFPQVAPKFFETRNNKLAGVDGDHVNFANKSHPV